MVHVAVQRVVDVAASQAWDDISDFENFHRVHPQVRKTRVTSSAEKGVGAERVLYLHDGTSVVERATQWDEGSQTYTCELLGSNMKIIQSASVQFSVCDADDSDCSKLVARVDYRLKYGPLGQLMGLVCLPMIKKRVDSILAGVEYHASTGKEVPENFVAPRRRGASALSPEYLWSEDFD